MYFFGSWCLTCVSIFKCRQKKAKMMFWKSSLVLFNGTFCRKKVEETTKLPLTVCFWMFFLINSPRGTLHPASLYNKTVYVNTFDNCGLKQYRIYFTVIKDIKNASVNNNNNKNDIYLYSIKLHWTRSLIFKPVSRHLKLHKL